MKQLISVVLLISAMMVSKAYGQKVGHVNFQSIIQLLPEFDTAKKKLEAYRDVQLSSIQFYENEIQASYDKYQKESKKVPVNKTTLELIEQQITTSQQVLETLKQSVQDSISNKNQELYVPLQDKVNKAIEAVAKEKGYSHVIDSSPPSVLLYAKESESLDEAVKAKLGIVKKP